MQRLLAAIIAWLGQPKLNDLVDAELHAQEQFKQSADELVREVRKAESEEYQRLGLLSNFSAIR